MVLTGLPKLSALQCFASLVSCPQWTQNATRCSGANRAENRTTNQRVWGNSQTRRRAVSLLQLCTCVVTLTCECSYLYNYNRFNGFSLNKFLRRKIFGIKKDISSGGTKYIFSLCVLHVLYLFSCKRWTCTREYPWIPVTDAWLISDKYASVKIGIS